MSQNESAVKDEANTEAIIDSQDNTLKRCEFICKKKNRRCKLLASKDRPYCGEHYTYSEQNKKETDENIKRIQCPLDPKHSIYLKDLEKHLKKCNSREVNLGPFDVKDVNKYSSDQDDADVDKTDIEKFLVKNLLQNELDELIGYLLKLDSDLNLSKKLDINYKEDNYINEQIDLNYTGTVSQKHLKQISSIVGHIKNLNINTKTDSICFIELGAGRGKLSHWLSLSLSNSNAKYLLVERGSQRYKFDGYHNDDVSTKFERVRMDIKNLYLNELDLVENCDNLILYGKHLCGSATDYTLHCLKRTLNDKHKFKGLLLAVCCHHYCDWDTFCGRKYFKNKLNLTRRQFYIIRNLTSWATCGQRNSDQDQEKVIYREKIGYICKNLIDLARMNYMAESTNADNRAQFNAKLFYYCDQSITLENRMLLVTPNN